MKLNKIAKRLVIVAVSSSLLLTTACAAREPSSSTNEGAAAAEGDLKVVRVVLPRAKELAGEDVYLHAAEALGYAEENGITFEFESAIGTTDGTKLVTTGQADVTVPSPFVAITARSNDLPIVSVFNTLQTNIFGFGVQPGSPITSIADLKGKRVALGDGGWTTIAAPLLASAGLTVDDVEWVVAGERRQLAVQQGEVDAVLTWEMEYQNWADQGVDVDVFGQDSVEFQSNGLIVSDSLVKDDPELVQAIVRSAAMGAEFVKLNPEAGAEIALATFEGVTPKTEEGMLAVVKSLVGLMTGGEALEKGFGVHNVEAWSNEIDVLHEQGVISKTFPAKDIVTNQFIEYANDFDHEEVAADAASYAAK